jgi:hypothetical protein
MGILDMVLILSTTFLLQSTLTGANPGHQIAGKRSLDRDGWHNQSKRHLEY